MPGRHYVASVRDFWRVCSGINEMDASGEETLSLMVDRLKSAGIQISLSGVNESVREVLRRTHLLEKIGREHLYTISSRAITLVHQPNSVLPSNSQDLTIKQAM